MALFELKRVQVSVGEAALLDIDELRIAAHGVTTIVGPSGSGKSTLLRLLNRLDVPTTGAVAYRGENLDDLDPVGLRRRVAMVFQVPPVFPGTVLDNLRVAVSELSPEEGVSALGDVGLAGSLLDQDAVTLSGGEAQRMCLARALLTRPEVLLADEPTAALDHVARSTLEALVLRLVEGGMPVVWVSHDFAQVQRLASSVVVMRQGRIVAHDGLAAVEHSADPDVRSTIGELP